MFGKTPIPPHDILYNVIKMASIMVETGSCDPGECDTFQFMAKDLGINVLHPGGLSATKILAERCSISKDMTLLDVG